MKTCSDTLPVEGRTERIGVLEKSGEYGTQHAAGRFPSCRKWLISSTVIKEKEEER